MNIDKILKELTLEEKASLCSGSDFWHTEEIKRLDIPSIMVSDGPHGLRKMRDDTDNPNEAIKAVCFPCACALACSFDRKLLTTLGKALGEECQAEDVSVILGILLRRPLSCFTACHSTHKGRSEQGRRNFP